MDAEPKIPLPAIVVCLRVVGCLSPIAGIVLAGAANMETGPGWGVVQASGVVSLLFFALGSVIRLLDRIDKHASQSKPVSTV
jgi:hypothetical protein